MLLGVVVTPFVGILGPAQLLGVESQRCRVRGVRVGLHDVPSKDAEYDAIAGARTDPPQGAHGAPRNRVWQRARNVVADGGFAVYAAFPFVVLRVVLFSHLLELSPLGAETLSAKSRVPSQRRRRATKGEPRR